MRRIRDVSHGLTLHPQYRYLLLATITGIATLLRFYGLGEWSFWIDEIYTVERVLAHINPEELLATWWLPPLSQILTSGIFHFFGVSEWSARLAPALIGIVSIPLLYVPIHRLFGVRVALIAAVLLAVSPWHLYWSQNARFYTSLTLFYTLASFAFFFAIEHDRPRYILVFFFLLFLAAGERLLALLLIPKIAIYLLLLQVLPFPIPSGFRSRNLLILLAPVLAFGLLELYLYQSGDAYLNGIVETFVGRPIDDPLRIVTLVIFNIGVPLVTLSFFAGVFLVKRKGRAGLFLFVSAVAPLLLLAAANPFMFTVDRYVFMTLPFWIILAAIGVNELLMRTVGDARILGVAVMILLLTDAGSSHLMYYQINSGSRPDWKGAFEFVQQRKADGDVIVSTRPEIGVYYTGEDVIALGDIAPEEIERGFRRYWFVVDSEGIWHFRVRLKNWMEQNSELLDVRYLRVRENINLRIYRYDPVHRLPVQVSHSQ